MAVAEQRSDRVLNPIDLIEQLAHGHDWPLERASDEELTLIVAGTWADYHISINWRDDLEALHLACAFDFRVPENRLHGNVPADRADQRAALARPLRSVDAGRARHVPPCAAA